MATQNEGTAAMTGMRPWYDIEPYNGKVVDCGTFVNSVARPVESLNGRWNHALDQYNVFFKKQWWTDEDRQRFRKEAKFPYDYSFNDWPEIDVPSTINTAVPEAKYFEGAVEYTRKFNYRKHADGERVFLKIGAAHHRSAAFVNGHYLGQHLGGFTPHYMEITDLLDLHNRIIVAVDTSRNNLYIPTPLTDWFNYGGLYRDVELIRVPATFIRDYFVRLVPGSDFRKVAIDVVVNGAQKADVQVEIAELGVKTTVSVDSSGRGQAVIDCQPQLWSPDAPTLYDVVLTCGTDRVADRIGLREIRVEGLDILLNGEKIWLRGICCHEDHPQRGRTLTEDDVRTNFALAKELNCNFMRLAHYPHHERSARIADEMGLLLWEEIPVYWDVAFGSPDTLADARNQLSELIRRDRNRASVIIWSVGNENLDTDERLAFMGNLAGLAHELDDSRLVSAACLIHNDRFDDRLIEHLDVIGMNEYYGWYSPDFEKMLDLEKDSLPDKPVIITETGGGALSGHHGTKDTMWTEEFQAEIYRKQTEYVPQLKSVRGLSPWILYDFRAPFRLNRYQQGYNRKGLLNPDRTYRKQAFYVLRDFYGRLAGEKPA